MTLSNAGLERSAIDIEPGGTLNLWISEGATVTVDSGYGKKGGNGSSATEIQGGPGGYAGIHVPTGEDDSTTEDDATLNLSGDGILKSFGGNAGAGGTCPSNSYDLGRRTVEAALELV